MFNKEQIELNKTDIDYIGEKLRYIGEITECAECRCLIQKDSAIEVDTKEVISMFGDTEKEYYCNRCAPKDLEVKGVKYKRK